MNNHDYEAWLNLLTTAMQQAVTDTPVFDRGHMGERLMHTHYPDPDVRRVFRRSYRRAAAQAAFISRV